MPRGRKPQCVIELTDEERRELESRMRSTTISAGAQRRARIILLRAGGETLRRIAQRVGVARRHVGKWISRFAAKRVDGLRDKPGRGRKPSFSPGGGRVRGQAGVRAS